jgi:hypothetical protein
MHFRGELVKLPVRIVFAAIAALWVASPTYGQLPQATPFSADMQIDYLAGAEPQHWHGKLQVDGGHMRFDLQNPPHQGPTVLTNFATQTDDVLLPPMKTYVEHPVSDAHARGPALAMRDLRPYNPDNPCKNQFNMSCRRIGVEPVSGRACDHWELSGKDQVVNLWLDQKLHFPLKSVTEDATVALSNINVGEQPASLFQIPADYKKMNMNPKPGTVPSPPQN